MSTPRAPTPPSAASRPPEGTPRDDGPDDALLDELSSVEFEALRWSVRTSEGLSDDARTAFEAWLDASPAHRAAYEDIAGVLDAIDAIPPAGVARLRTTMAIDMAASSSRVLVARAHAGAPVEAGAPDAASTASPSVREAATVAAESPEQPRPSAAQGRRRAMLQAAAVGLAAWTVGGAGWLGWQHWQSQPVFSRDYATDRGRNLDVALPDGSTLLLDAASTASVTLYRSRRQVQLTEGQALFQVQADADRPFDVLAGSTRITVVGTRFSVRYTPSLGDSTVQVAVIEGRVRVSSRAQGSAKEDKAVLLQAGQALEADAQGQFSEVRTVPADAVASWRKQRLDFEGVPLVRVLAEIARYGDIGVRVADPAVGRLPVTASVNLQNLGAFLRTLPQVLPVRIETRDGAQVIVGNAR